MIDLDRMRQLGLIVNQTNIGTVSKATVGKLMRDEVKHIYSLSQAFRYHLEPK